MRERANVPSLVNRSAVNSWTLKVRVKNKPLRAKRRAYFFAFLSDIIATISNPKVIAIINASKTVKAITSSF